MNKLVEAMARAIRAQKDNARSVEDQAEAAINAVEGTGWKLVPVEPTEEMTEASRIQLILQNPDGGPIAIYGIAKWNAMLAASPNPLDE